MPITCRTRNQNTRWFKNDRDYLCVNKSQFVPVIFEPHCIYVNKILNGNPKGKKPLKRIRQK